MSTTLLPTLAIVVAGWSYGAQDLSLRLQREQNEIAFADMRGLLTFEAAHDQEWNVTLQKADGEPFEIDDLALIPTYQISRDEGPIDGPSVDVLPSYSSREGSRIAKIPNALGSICRVEKLLCSGDVRLIMLTLDFSHGGKRYRIVANPEE
jgi:hypothetical protein